MTLHRIMTLDSSFPYLVPERNNPLDTCLHFLNKFLNSFNIIMFGINQTSLGSIYSINPVLSESTFFYSFDINNFINNNSLKDFHEIFEKLPVGNQLYIIAKTFSKISISAKYGSIKGVDSELYSVWHYLTYHLYTDFFRKISFDMHDTSSMYIHNRFVVILNGFLLFLISHIILILLVFKLIQKLKNSLLWMVKPLLIIDPKILISSNYIMKFLLGHLTNQYTENFVFKDSYFQTIIENSFDDIIICTDKILNIIYFNNNSLKLFNKEDLINFNFKKLLSNNIYFKLKSDEFFIDLEDAIIGRKQFDFWKTFEYINLESNEKIYKLIGVYAHTKDGIIESNIGSDSKIESFSFIIKDKSVFFNSQQQYELEKEKMYKILSSIIIK